MYIFFLGLGFALFMMGVCWSIYYLLKLAHDEDPGCLNPGRHK